MIVHQGFRHRRSLTAHTSSCPTREPSRTSINRLPRAIIGLPFSHMRIYVRAKVSDRQVPSDSLITPPATWPSAPLEGVGT